MAMAAGIVPLEPLLGGKQTEAEAADITYSETNRANNAFNYRKQEAQAEKISTLQLRPTMAISRCTQTTAARGAKRYSMTIWE